LSILDLGNVVELSREAGDTAKGLPFLQIHVAAGDT
jgi:hypothetical protein